MNTFRLTVKLFVIATFLLAFASMAQAQATRTWVSGVGDDVNPCSRTAPCKTYAGAISKTATNGEISTLDPGGFGAVNITKGLTIDGTTGAGFGSILASGTTGVIVNEPGTNPVILRNLSINGASTTAGSGVRYLNGKSLMIENCYIFGFTGTGTVGRGVSVELTTTARNLVVRNTSITNCNKGVHITTSTGFLTAELDNVQILQPSATSPTSGIEIASNSFVVIRDSHIANYPTGVSVSGGAGSSAFLVRTTLFGHTTAFNVGASTSRMTASAIMQNSTGIALAGGVIRSGCDNFLDGNTNNVTGGAITNACVQ